MSAKSVRNTIFFCFSTYKWKTGKWNDSRVKRTRTKIRKYSAYIVSLVVLDLVGGRTARGRRLRFLLQYAHVLGRLQEDLVLAERRQRLPVLLLLLVVPLHLGPPVLEPRDHLRVRQAQAGRDLVPVGRRQVLLVQETFLQLEYLVVGERGARLAFLLGLRSRVEQVQVTGTRVCGTHETHPLILHIYILVTTTTTSGWIY